MLYLKIATSCAHTDTYWLLYDNIIHTHTCIRKPFLFLPGNIAWFDMVGGLGFRKRQYCLMFSVQRCVLLNNTILCSVLCEGDRDKNALLRQAHSHSNTQIFVPFACSSPFHLSESPGYAETGKGGFGLASVRTVFMIHTRYC